MSGTRYTFKDLLQEAYILYQQMEKKRNLVFLRTSKLPELEKLMQLSEKELPVEFLRKQQEFCKESGKFKNIIDLFAFCSACILGKESIEITSQLIDNLKPADDEMYNLVLSVVSEAKPDRTFETQFFELAKKAKQFIRQKKAQDAKAIHIADPLTVKIQQLSALNNQLQESFKITNSQNEALKKSLTKKEEELSEKIQLLEQEKRTTQRVEILLQEEKTKSETIQDNFNKAHTALETFIDNNKVLHQKLSDQMDINNQLNKTLAEKNQFYLLDPKLDTQVNDKNIKECLHYITADLVLEQRYNVVCQILNVDDKRNDSEACELRNLKIEIDNLYKHFCNIYKKVLFEENDGKTFLPISTEDKKTLETLASKASSKIIECHNLRLFNAGVKQSQTEHKNNREVEVNTKFKEKVTQVETKAKLTAAFYEEILKRIENIEKNKIAPLVCQIGHFAKRNYALLVETALNKQAEEVKQLRLVVT